MNREQFFKEGRWMTSFCLFSNRQVILHHPATTPQQSSSIKSMTIHPSYPSEQQLSQKLSKQLYSLTSGLKLQESAVGQSRIGHFLDMMKHVVKEAEVSTQSYHNVVFLTIKYLAFLVTKKAILSGEQLSEEVRMESWLADVHSIYFQEDEDDQLQELGEDKQLFELMRKGKYEDLVSQLRYYYSTVEPKDDDTATKIDLIVHLLILKINDRLNCLPELLNKKQNKFVPHRALTHLKEKFTKLVQVLNKSNKTHDFCSVLGRVITGNENELQKIAEKSWPLYSMFFLSFSSKTRNQVLEAVRSRYVNKGQLGRASKEETQYFLMLLEESNNHKIYQKLLSIVPPFYAHFLGYLFTQIKPSPIPSLVADNYSHQIVANMLDHASQISFTCLAFTYSALQSDESGSEFSLGQTFETLLFQHIKVIETAEKEELNKFLKKVQVLWMLKLEKYVYLELNALLKQKLEQGVINRQTFLLYAYSNTLFQNYYNYEQLLAYSLQQIFMSSKLDVSFLKEYQALKKETNSLDRKVVRQLRKVEPLLQKFYLIDKIVNLRQQKYQISLLGELMQKTYRSLAVLQLLQQLFLCFKPSPSQTDENYYDSRGAFQKEVGLFLLHYPIERTEEEDVMLKKVGRLVSCGAS